MAQKTSAGSSAQRLGSPSAIALSSPEDSVRKPRLMALCRRRPPGFVADAQDPSPWGGYLARYLDDACTGLGAAAIGQVQYRQGMPSVVLIFVRSITLSLLYETYCVHRLGHTFGEWAFGVRVQHADG